MFLQFTITLRVFWIAWVAWLVLVRGFARCLSQTLAWVVWVVWVHKNFGVKKKKDRGRHFGVGKRWFHKLSLWFYEILRMILVSSLYSLHILYCNKLSIPFTVFYVNPYSIVFMRSHYFPKSKDYGKSC